MSLDLRLLGEKLRRYREQFQASVDEVAAATGIAIPRLVQLEAGMGTPSGDEILIIADYYHCDFQFFISNERHAPFDQTETLFRRFGDELSRDDRWAVQEFLFLCECEEFLIGEVGSIPRHRFTFDKVGSNFKAHGAAAAVALRRHLGYGVNAIGKDIYRDLRRIGVHVFRRRLTNREISGLFVRHPAAGPCVLVNYDEDVFRQSFTVAHEAAHAILDDDEDVGVSFSKWSKSDLSEIRANTFASHYLVPREILRDVHLDGGWTAELAVEWAAKFGVSTMALSYALVDARLVSVTQAQALRSARVPAAMKQDPELPSSLGEVSLQRRRMLLERGLSTHYVSLCFEALYHDRISVARAAEMLLVDETELGEIATTFGLAMV